MNIRSDIHAKIESLVQLQTVTWDGNLLSKDTRDHLVKAGLVQRAHGFNWLTEKGVEYCITLAILKT